jgi:hypothetical protein
MPGHEASTRPPGGQGPEAETFRLTVPPVGGHELAQVEGSVRQVPVGWGGIALKSTGDVTDIVATTTGTKLTGGS